MTPIFVIAFLLVDERMDSSRHAEANAWLGSGYNLGVDGLQGHPLGRSLGREQAYHPLDHAPAHGDGRREQIPVAIQPLGGSTRPVTSPST
jgi:hypothetical protein